MNLKGLHLRLKTVVTREDFMMAHFASNIVHLRVAAQDRCWYEFEERGSLCTITQYDRDDLVSKTSPVVVYRVAEWHWPAIVASVGLPVRAEAAKLAG